MRIGAALLRGERTSTPCGSPVRDCSSADPSAARPSTATDPVDALAAPPYPTRRPATGGGGRSPTDRRGHGSRGRRRARGRRADGLRRAALGRRRATVGRRRRPDREAPPPTRPRRLPEPALVVSLAATWVAAGRGARRGDALGVLPRPRLGRRPGRRRRTPGTGPRSPPRPRGAAHRRHRHDRSLRPRRRHRRGVRARSAVRRPGLRSRITLGPGAPDRASKVPKSVSAVTTTRSSASARASTSLSVAPRRPRSSTCTASWPASVSATARSCCSDSSTSNFTRLRAVAAWPGRRRRRRIAVPDGCHPR